MKGSKLRKVLSSILILAMLLILGACGGSNTATVDEKSTVEQTSTKVEEVKVIDPLAKFDPILEVSAVKVMTDDIKFNNNDTIENNVWSRGYEKDLGIKIKYLWTVPQTQSEQKLNVTIASGDIPDIMQVNARQLKQLNDAGMIEDLTKVYQDYRSDLTKEIMESDGGMGLKQATFDGKLMALPLMGSSTNSAPLLWIRSDWLKNLNLEAPKTMNDVLKISKAFFENDPDKNGKADTFGLGLGKVMFDNLGGFATLNGFANSFHAFPGTWIKDSSGKLVYGDIQPEMKTALATAAEMYKNGQIDKEFSVKDAGKIAEAVTAGKIGMFFGLHWNPFYPLQDAVNKDPKADWLPYPIVSSDDKPITPSVGLSVEYYFVERKGISNPEAIIKICNYGFAKEYPFSKDYDSEFHYGVPSSATAEERAKNQVNAYKYALVSAANAQQNILIHKSYVEYFSTKDTSKLTAWNNDKNSIDQANKWIEGDGGKGLAGGVPTDLWGGFMWAGPRGSFSIIFQYLDGGLMKTPDFYGADTPTMSAKNSTLNKLRDEVFTKIIMGASGIDEFDQYVADWKKLGGDDITKEVNEWADLNK